MKFKDLPAGTKFLDVDGIAVADLPSGELVAFSDGKGLDVESRAYPNGGKADREGSPLTRDEFAEWLKTGKNRFFV
jgi:hypothetical protein